jgi:hypothetical protein
MSINRILKSLGVIIGSDIAFSVGIEYIFPEVLLFLDDVMDNIEKSNKGSSLIVPLLVSKFIPPVVIVDKYINQKLTDNKCIQYGLTAFESIGYLYGLTYSAVGTIEMPKTTINMTSDKIKLVLSLGMLKNLVENLALKYIWDDTTDADIILETPELVVTDLPVETI